MVLADIDFCTLRDVDALEDLEQRSFSQPWVRGIFAADLGRERTGALYLGAWLKGCLVGYGACAWTGARLHILRLAVAPQVRRFGVGSQLLVALGEIGVGASCRRVFLELRKSNTGAGALYARFGFVEVEVRKNYYSENGEDALILEAPLPLRERLHHEKAT